MTDKGVLQSDKKAWWDKDGKLEAADKDL